MPFERSEGASEEGGGRRRRRRRRRRGGGPDVGHENGAAEPVVREDAESEAPARPRGRRLAREDAEGQGVPLPSTGKLVHRPRTHRRKWKPMAGMARRRRLSRVEIDDLVQYFSRLPEPLLGALYRALGGQPTRVPDTERMVHLTVRAVAQGNRLGGLVHQMHQRDRQALAALIQCGGIAHADEFHRELVLVLGGREQDWARTMQVLGDRGLVFASDAIEDGFYYLVPEPLVDQLLEHLESELALPTFQHEDVRVVDQRPFCPPLDFSLTTLATYLDQRPPRLTQRQEVFKGHKDELDRFFAQVWSPDSELFNLHFDFLMMHGMIELRGDRVAVNRDVIEEWLNLEPEDQRDLVFRALEKRFPLSEWVLWAIQSGKGEWIPEAPLVALYRRWKRGEDWRERFHKGIYASPRGTEREGYSFTPLVTCGMVELGMWGQQKFFRLSPRATALLDPPEDEGFKQFYLTPSYEIMAPAGLAPILLFRIGELAELTGCDRANTYKITEVTIEQALHKGWRREEVFDFLRENSQIGLPENVEQTLRAWMGQEGDVEFHEITALTVHRSAVRRFEALRAIKPFLLHRFAPGLYAVDRRRLPEIAAALAESGFNPSKEIRRYPADEEAAEARERLHLLLAEAREQREDPIARAHSADTQPEELRPIPGGNVAQGAARQKKREQGPPRTSTTELRAIIDRAISQGLWVEMTYLSAKDQTRKQIVVVPERIALNREGNAVLVATDVAQNLKLSYALAQIERARSAEPKSA
ncbi:MAG: helicase-associated domain-containing protein [Myxococcota bacterium]